MQNRSAFYKRVTGSLFRGSLPAWQREPLDRLIDAGLARERPLEEAAYVLATAFHETDRFKAMEEYGQGSGRPYGDPVRLWSGKTASYHGRGYCQLTWLGNYARASVALGVDFVNAPDLAADPTHAAGIIWEGMISGWFTGKNLADYIRPAAVDYKGARRIINGTDRAQDIAGYAEEFAKALNLISDDAPEAAVCPRADCPLMQGAA